MTVSAQFCPNCGAPLTVVAGKCAFCEAPLAISTPTGPVAPHDTVPVGDPHAPFSMTVDDVFVIKGKGAVATGRVAAGTVRVGGSLVLEHGGKTRTVVCTAIEMFRKQLDEATPGQNVGLILQSEKHKDLDRADVSPGDHLGAG